MMPVLSICTALMRQQTPNTISLHIVFVLPSKEGVKVGQRGGFSRLWTDLDAVFFLKAISKAKLVRKKKRKPLR